MKNLLKKVGMQKNQIIPVDIKSSEPAFLELYERCKPFTMTSVERMYVLYQAVQHIVNQAIPGDFVECGVWKGGSTMLTAYALTKLNEQDRHLFLYDTFTGMTEPGTHDYSVTLPTAHAKTKWTELKRQNHNEWCFAPIKEVQKNISRTGYPESRVHFVKGKVEDTLPKHAPELISLLRLDTDWYESTKHELEYLFPRLVKGGVLIIDDYGHWVGAKKAVDEYFEKRIHPLLIRIDTTGRIGIK